MLRLHRIWDLITETVQIVLSKVLCGGAYLVAPWADTVLSKSRPQMSSQELWDVRQLWLLGQQRVLSQLLSYLWIQGSQADGLASFHHYLGVGS